MYLRYCIQKLKFRPPGRNIASLLINNDVCLYTNSMSYGYYVVIKNELWASFYITNCTNIKKFIKITNKKSGVKYTNYHENFIVHVSQIQH